MIPEAKKRVLVCPLNWGLGHATRDIPIINALLAKNNEVLIAADGLPLQLLQEEFPQLQTIRFPSFTMTYSSGESQSWQVLRNIPRLLFWTMKEHFMLKKIIKLYNIDVIISDARYGVWAKQAHSVFITHQIVIQMPARLRFLESFVCRINMFFIKKFDVCWIPDSHEIPIAGELAGHHKTLPSSFKYVGLLSRFDNSTQTETSGLLYDILVVLSGPEPQRSIFEKKIISQLARTKHNCLLIRGSASNEKVNSSKNVAIVPFMNAKELKKAIDQSKVVICRSGYSSIMDLIALRKKAILIPTPGQTEQDYLAEYLKEKRCFYSVSQSEFNLEKALLEYEVYSPLITVDFFNAEKSLRE